MHLAQQYRLPCVQWSALTSHNHSVTHNTIKSSEINTRTCIAYTMLDFIENRKIWGVTGKPCARSDYNVLYRVSKRDEEEVAPSLMRAWAYLRGNIYMGALWDVCRCLSGTFSKRERTVYTCNQLSKRFVDYESCGGYLEENLVAQSVSDFVLSLQSAVSKYMVRQLQCCAVWWLSSHVCTATERAE